MKFKYKNKNSLRVDKMLAERLEDRSRSQIKKVIKKGFVKINGSIVKKPSYSVKYRDIIEISFPKEKETTLKPEKLDIEIVYEDKYIAIVNKPAGMLVHPTKNKKEGTLANALLYHFNKLSEINEIRPGIVHRIDKNTSGLLIVAKNNKAHRKISSMIQRKDIERKYWALLKGNLKKPTGEIIAPIGRNKSNRTKMDVVLEGKHAHTKYRIVEKYKNYTLAEFSLTTGRTHQIRVHASFIGTPVLGDVKYGGTITDKRFKFVKRQLLHSKILSFQHPYLDKKIDIEISVPEDFQKVLDKLKSGNYS
ncbi:MAG: RluA family pseudouridine synthase [Candidatus Mcinerneyibacterium aminivorans]|uniref:Pseudouridine synthase n=1 Tax=Candidatus Mcinerneyibacterium aminivorans TaxID=2703815 RepID=A0A5D0MGI4_9BACT|nr:MAG: RluA family pseudouridine synthase [Candidatus Mcinerneyibacterium aminivorans]